MFDCTTFSGTEADPTSTAREGAATAREGEGQGVLLKEETTTEPTTTTGEVTANLTVLESQKADHDPATSASQGRNRSGPHPEIGMTEKGTEPGTG